MATKRYRANPTTPRAKCIAVIGDVVSSKEVRGDQRRKLQHRITATLDQINRTMEDGLVADFTVTLGDEFECVVKPEMAEKLVPDLIWIIERALSEVGIRFGIGIGTIDTDLSRDPRAMDGSAFHAARDAIRNAAESGRLGGVYRGFGEEFDSILNGLSRLLHHHRAGWSTRQLRVADLLRSGLRATEAAAALKVTKQAISKSAQASGWESYQEGEEGWRKAIHAAVRCGCEEGQYQPST